MLLQLMESILYNFFLCKVDQIYHVTVCSVEFHVK